GRVWGGGGGPGGQPGGAPAAARRLDRESGRGGRLADPAAADAEDDPPRLEDRGETTRAIGVAHAARPVAAPSSAASAATSTPAPGGGKRKGSRIGAAP